MPNKHISSAVLLLFLLVGCSPTNATIAPAATATVTVSPSLSLPLPLTSTPNPSPSPTPERTDSLDLSKYAGVYVHTFEEQANEGRSLLHVAYPVTEHPTINARMKALAEAFIEEFTSVSTTQEQAYQDYILQTGETAASFVTQYIQHFDVTVADASLISLAIEQYRFLGGTGSTAVVGVVFDRTTGTELGPADVFQSEAYLERLSQLAREVLERDARAEAEDSTFDSEAARDEWLMNRLLMIENGTEPLAENFDSILFHDDGTLHMQFDKYQVAPGAYGVIEVVVPVASVVDLLNP